MDILQSFAAKHNPAPRFPDLRPGWTVRVHQKIDQGEKKKGGKASIFEGIIVSRKHGNEAGATITVRRAEGGYGVEKTFPLILPSIEKIEVVKRSNVRRAKLYYLRDKTAREIRRKTRSEMASEKAEQISKLRAEQAKRRDAEKEAQAERQANAAQAKAEREKEPAEATPEATTE